MEYVGIVTQQRRNNIRTFVLLFLFPCLVTGLVYLFCFLLGWLQWGNQPEVDLYEGVGILFVRSAPFAIGGVLLWFVIAYFVNVSVINAATGAKPLTRKENMRVYNLVENLCMTQGMRTPKINIMYDDSLNAYASGINESTYTVTLSQGIIEKLNDEELEGVIAHELTHIRNRDVRLLIVSIVFVGIFAMLSQITLNVFLRSPRVRSRNNKNNGVVVIILIALVVSAIGYLFASLMRFAISRKREYMADAGAAEMTRNPLGLANALRKISGNPTLTSVTRKDVAQLFIASPCAKTKKALLGFSGLFATHPPIEKRIEILENF